MHNVKVEQDFVWAVSEECTARQRRTNDATLRRSSTCPILSPQLDKHFNDIVVLSRCDVVQVHVTSPDHENIPRLAILTPAQDDNRETSSSIKSAVNVTACSF